jgi:hypothetical protein
VQTHAHTHARTHARTHPTPTPPPPLPTAAFKVHGCCEQEWPTEYPVTRRLRHSRRALASVLSHTARRVRKLQPESRHGGASRRGRCSGCRSGPGRPRSVPGSTAVPRGPDATALGPVGTSEYSGRVLMAMALRARALRPCAQCASSHAAMASPLSAVNRLPIAPWPVGSDARWAHATRHAATVHPGFLTRAKGGKAGTVERAHLPACIFNVP